MVSQYCRQASKIKPHPMKKDTQRLVDHHPKMNLIE
jgi:hypothetical protein